MQTGITIVRRALEEPVRQIAANAGYEGSIIIDKLKSAEKVLASMPQLVNGLK